MKIRHEAPDADMDWKVQAPLMLETPTGATVRIESWSLSGLVWPADAPDCPKTGTLSVPFQGVDVRFPVRLLDRDGTGFISLEGLSGRQRETLALFYRSLLSGRMASSGEVITSLDTPVDLVPMEQTEAEQSKQPMRFLPGPIRAVLNVSVYLLIAAMVVGVIGNNIFTNLDSIDIQHGRVSTPKRSQFPAQSGYVEQVNVRAGQHVQAGDVLVRLRDPELTADLQDTNAKLAMAQNTQGRVVLGLQELSDQRQSTNIAERIAVAARIYATFIGAEGFDELRQQWLALRVQDGELAKASDPLNVITGILQAEQTRNAAALNSLSARRDALLDMIEQNHIRAPSDGTVRAIQAKVGQVLSGQEAGLSFETEEPRVTIGWVSEKFADTLFVGMPATITFNEQGDKVTLNGVITDIKAANDPERPGEFGILVTVTPSDLTATEADLRLRPGAPVNLKAKRQLGTRLSAWLTQLWTPDG